MQYCTVLYWTVASLRHATYRYSTCTVPVQYCTGSGFGRRALALTCGLCVGELVVRFVGVIRVPLCARVSRVPRACVPAVPRCLFTGTGILCTHSETVPLLSNSHT